MRFETRLPESHREGSVLLISPGKRQVLLQLRTADAPIAPSTWCVFGGATEPNESPLETVQREIEEELCVTAEPNELVHLASLNSVPIYQHVVAHTRFRTLSEFRLLEGDGMAFFTEEQLTHLPLAPLHKQWLQGILPHYWQLLGL